MALVERLMGEPYVSHSEKIGVHQFFAGQNEVMQGYLTVAQVKSFYNMDAATAAEYDALVAKTPAANQTANRALFVERIHGVFILAETGVPGYDTPSAVRAKLGI